LFSGTSRARINPLAPSIIRGAQTNHTSNYASVRQQYYNQYGAENVYFVSERFSEYASPETLVARSPRPSPRAAASAGSSAKEVINQVRSS